MASRNLSSISMLQGPRAVWNLPWSIFNAARRTMMVPCLLCAAVVEALDPSVFSLREVSTVAGFIIGLQLIIISVLLLCHGEASVLPFVPAYVVFRMYRAYVAFETVLTLPLAPPRRATVPAALAWFRGNPRLALPLAGTTVAGVVAALWIPHVGPAASTTPPIAGPIESRDATLHAAVPRSRRPVIPAASGWTPSSPSAACRLRLPASWQLVVSSRHQGPGWIMVARPRGQRASVRCTVAPSTVGDPYRLALRVRGIVSKHAGFRLLDFRARTISGRPAYEIDYVSRAHGVLIQHRRVFVKGRAHLEAMAPAAGFPGLAATFEGIFESYDGRRAASKHRATSQ
jgi:hypothetical protein